MSSRGNESSLLLDAYTSDEMGPKNTPQNCDLQTWPRGPVLLSKSKFTDVGKRPNGSVTETPQTVLVPTTNKANPRHNKLLNRAHLQTNIPSAEVDKHFVWVYVSPSTFARRDALAGAPWNPPIRVSVLYGVGKEMNRHGLRSAVAAKSEPSALVLVPGIEPENNPSHRRWGVGINELDLRHALDIAVGRPIDYRTSVLAAYSTGINGLNQTLLHDLLNVSQVERVIFYDCMYEKSSGSTAAALLNARRRAGLKLNIVAYKCTGKPGTSQGGNTLDQAGNLSVAGKNPGLVHPDGIVADFFDKFRSAYVALIMCRSLESAIADGLIVLSGLPELDKAYSAMSTIMPKRGTVVSRAATWRYVYGSSPPAGTVLFETWASDKTNQRIIRQFVSQLGSKVMHKGFRNIVWSNHLPGWDGGPSDGEENHDLLLPDFSWEYLPA